MSTFTYATASVPEAHTDSPTHEAVTFTLEAWQVRRMLAELRDTAKAVADRRRAQVQEIEASVV
jgi:hypothetical protein